MTWPIMSTTRLSPPTPRAGAYPSTNPFRHRPDSVGGSPYLYDENGNLTSAEGRTYEYDRENRLWRVSEGTQVKGFAYDGDGSLCTLYGTSQTDPKRHYVTPEYQVDLPAGTPVVYYRFGGRAVAWSDGGSPHYLMADHLGSVQGETDGGTTRERRAYPFGSDRAVSGANDLTRDERYTGQKRIDHGSGVANRELYHYGARFYLPGVGLFSQPDTIVPDPKNPQALNRYAYVYNSPVAYRDPSGNNPIPDQGVENPDYPTHLPPQLRDAYLRLYYASPEGKALALYLCQVDPYFSSWGTSPGAGMALTPYFRDVRVILINGDGLSVEAQAALLGHETKHLMQNDLAGNGVVSQVDEIEAYQLQGRLMKSMGVSDPSGWSEDPAQSYGLSGSDARDKLIKQWSVYGEWPAERPADPVAVNWAGRRQAWAVASFHMKNALATVPRVDYSQQDMSGWVRHTRSMPNVW